MYLEYDEYVNMRGTLEQSAFIPLERKARYLINSQAGGQTGERIGRLTELPQVVKDCMYELISFLSVNAAEEKQISSESQSQGGASESYSYVTRTDEEIARQCSDIIEQCFYGGGIGGLLYRGACV